MPEFHFDKASHSYWLDGEQLPGITSLLKLFSDRILSHVPDPDVVEAARIRGTAAHLAVERFNKGECDRYESGYTEAWAKFCDDTGFKPSHVEFSTYHPGLKFAATIDVLGALADGREYLPDIKTGSSYKYLPLQTAGQAMCLSAHGLCDRNVLRSNVFLFEKNGEWTYRIEEHNNEDDFEALVAYIKWNRSKERYL